MNVKVKYYKPELCGYGGREYIFKTELPNVIPFTKVIVMSGKGEPTKAIVTEINVPDSEIDPAWAYKLKSIVGVDVE